MSPRGLDLFARAGGSTAGYVQAGFHMTAVDIVDRAALNPADKFVVADALEFLDEHGAEFDFIHAGPPCQADNPQVVGTNGGKGGHLSLMEPTLARLRQLGVPYVVENPPGRARDRGMRYDLTLCGEMFPETAPGDDGKPGVIRHRKFEIGGWSTGPAPHSVFHPKHRGRVRGVRHGEYFAGPYVAVYGEGGYKASIDEAQRAMGIDWMSDRGDLNEAIPPAYTRWIGRQWLA